MDNITIILSIIALITATGAILIAIWTLIQTIKIRTNKPPHQIIKTILTQSKATITSPSKLAQEKRLLQDITAKQ